MLSLCLCWAHVLQAHPQSMCSMDKDYTGGSGFIINKQKYLPHVKLVVVKCISLEYMCACELDTSTSITASGWLIQLTCSFLLQPPTRAGRDVLGPARPSPPRSPLAPGQRAMNVSSNKSDHCQKRHTRLTPSAREWTGVGNSWIKKKCILFVVLGWLWSSCSHWYTSVWSHKGWGEEASTQGQWDRQLPCQRQVLA